MSFRQVIVRKANYLSVNNNSLVVDDGIEKKKIILEDIAIIVIENSRSTISLKLINKCMEEKIVIIICNENFLPSGIISSFSNHYRQLENIYLQLNLNTVKKQNIWRTIIKNKISSQIEIIKLTTNNLEDIEIMNKYKEQVKRNDCDNREAVTAKFFYNAMYGSDFKRFTDDKINGILNYGYAILSSSIIRQLLSLGIDTRFGIWHRSKSNAFNLAYDLVEPFRPLIDYYIKSNMHLIDNELRPSIRRDLISLLNCNVEIDGCKYRLQNALEIYAKRYLSILKGEEQDFMNVKILKIKFYEI